jgi:hypothetical protein
MITVGATAGKLASILPQIYAQKKQYQISSLHPVAFATAAALPVASTTTISSRDKVAANAVRKLRRVSTRPSRRSLPTSQATASEPRVYQIQ